MSAEMSLELRDQLLENKMLQDVSGGCNRRIIDRPKADLVCSLGKGAQLDNLLERLRIFEGRRAEAGKKPHVA